MKKTILAICMLLNSLVYAQQEHKRVEVDRLWEILSRKGAGSSIFLPFSHQNRETPSAQTNSKKKKIDLLTASRHE